MNSIIILIIIGIVIVHIICLIIVCVAGVLFVLFSTPGILSTSVFWLASFVLDFYSHTVI